MAGGSTSQTSTAVTRGGRGGVTAGSAGAGSLRQRRPAGAARSSRGFGSSMMNFYTDDSPGIKIQPVWVIVMSLSFILFVTILHIIGKLRG
ncbi:hypothetical protein Rsub_11961 [Raphidocelis subcapitata]|uniref:Protein transport protein Sec61 subunit beta n=1 Tax=Raphidocelis subcapitata TaxID=307507 RepID=A0A2V0PPW9_9CHLO|nr:hypothetical protein Rsub_11961 [Raphidocelis subcapitata]|eukprot:GBF99527.1 hypothetical protein Rsub_11961 [Raphidocelis subcapitata]